MESQQYVSISLISVKSEFLWIPIFLEFTSCYTPAYQAVLMKLWAWIQRKFVDEDYCSLELKKQTHISTTVGVCSCWAQQNY